MSATADRLRIHHSRRNTLTRTTFNVHAFGTLQYNNLTKHKAVHLSPIWLQQSTGGSGQWQMLRTTFLRQTTAINEDRQINALRNSSQFKKLMTLKVLTQVQWLWPSKGNSLHKNMSYDIQIIKICPFVFAQLTVLPNTPKSYALQVRHPKSAPYHDGIYNSCNRHFLDPHDTATQSASQSVQPFFAQLTAESVYTLERVAQFKKLLLQLMRLKN